MITYVPKRFNGSSVVIITQANSIIEEYAKQGFILTLRQLYYQFVSRDLIENTQKAYKRLGSIVNDARLAGLISWQAIEDRTRHVKSWQSWESPADAVRDTLNCYQIDKWENQPYRPEVWIEKEALAGVFDRVCMKLDISYFCCRGYNSQSEMWRSSMRFSESLRVGQEPVVLHFGDHDPSGIDMTKDIMNRLDIFVGDGLLQVDRLALNMNQVKKFKPPPNPAKITDSRYKVYVREFGTSSWELDALEPKVLSKLVEKSVLAFRDEDLWNEKLEEEAADVKRLEEVVLNLK
jgi:hypothetical protein